jgi:predicted Fe-Mo cluster-binding NifX family protein
MSAQKIAVTADMENGLESPVSGHFGHCKAFIVSTVEDGEIINVETVPNQGHTSCAEPVMRLANIGVNVLITMGMGMRPFMAAQQVGLTVVKSGESTEFKINYNQSLTHCACGCPSMYRTACS